MLIGTFASTVTVEWIAAWTVSVVLTVAALIDGAALRVPNWLTWPFLAVGCVYSTCVGGWPGLLHSLAGVLVGMGLLLPLLAIGGMGTGDVKLLMGVGAWLHPAATWHAFCLTALCGGVLALLMVARDRAWRRHAGTFCLILTEFWRLRRPARLARRAAARKDSMLLLPYGIPMAVGTIVYLWWAGSL